MREFPHNCGIGVLGPFEYLNPFNFADKTEFTKELDLLQPLAQTSIKEAIEHNQSGDDEDGNGNSIDPKKVYIATTSERQTPAIQALKNLGFRALTSWRGNEGKITLWFRKAEL